MEILKNLFFGKGYIDGITILNLEGEILFSAKFNKKLSNLEESQQMVGRQFLEVYDNLTPKNSTLYRAMELGMPIYQEKQYLKKHDKEGITITALSIPIKSGDRIVGAIDLSVQEAEETEAEPEYVKIELNREGLKADRTQKLSSQTEATFEYQDIIAVNETMKRAKEYIKVVAACDLPVMIYGETGTGKEVFAQAIHNASARRGMPFIAQNCAAIPDTLLESVLFGTAKGAFTGAVESKGLLELADGGTLFLDELNSMPPYLQSKLLRVLQDGVFRSLGSGSIKQVNVKVIAALNKPPLQAIADGELRQDIYYRLSMMSINIPPLRERTEDIYYFVEYYVKKHNVTFHKHICYISNELINHLKKYAWPGNVRELEHVIVYGMSMVDPESDTLRLGDIEGRFRELSSPQTANRTEPLCPPLKTAVCDLEQSIIETALGITQGNITRAAKLLDIPRQTLQRKIKQYQIDAALWTQQ